MKKHLLPFLLMVLAGFACTNATKDPAIKPGTTWVPVALNKEQETVSAFVTVKNGQIIAGTSAGLMLSENGTAWQPATVPATAKAAVFSLTVDANGLIYAGMSKYGILVSAGNGNSWTLQSDGLNPGGPRTTYALLATPGRIFKGSFESGLYVSDNNGKNWAPANNGIPLNLGTSRMVSVTQLAKNEKTLYALTDLGLRWSADNGKSFQKPAHNGITRLGYMSSLAASGKNIFCGVTAGDKGVYMSTDNGENWKPAGLGGKAPHVLAILGGKLYAGTEGQVYVSSDLGNTWTAIGAGLPANAPIYAIGVTKEGNLLAGLNRGGIYMLR